MQTHAGFLVGNPIFLSPGVLYLTGHVKVKLG